MKNFKIVTGIKISRIYFSLIIVVLCVISVLSQSSSNLPAKLTADEAAKWREDLQFIERELPAKHKNLFHRLDRETFYNAVKELNAKIPTLTKNQVAMELQRIVAMAKDGHTWLSPFREPSMNFHAFPIGLYIFEDGIFVLTASPEYKALVGGKVLKIEDTPIDAAYEKISPYMFADNEMGIKNLAPRYLVSPEVLQALGITNSLNSAVFEIEKDGKIFKAEIKIDPNEQNSTRRTLDSTKNWTDANENSSNSIPLTLKNPGERFWFEYVKEQKLLYVQLNSVLNGENKTLEQFFSEVFDFAEKNEIDKFVLDIRHNGGGNNTLLRPIIRGLLKLDKIDHKGHLFVIIGRRTFSAAQNLTNELENWTEAVFVGEPTASHVNLYGDARRFELPNSKMQLWISELFWQNKHARDERKWTAPQLAAEPSFNDYANNNDPAMKAILEYKPQKSLREMAMEAVQTNQIKAFLEKVVGRRNNPLYKYQTSESDLNEFGYALIRMKKFDNAIDVFKLNVEFYPESFNVYDSLAEAYMLNGEKELAFKFYKKSLELNPNNIGAIRQIEKLEKEK